MHVVLSSSMLSLEFDLWVTLCFCSLFFFFKQKTAYEMRISDWSSDVCSSDLKPDGSPSGIDNAEGFSVGGNIGFAGFTFGGSFADTKGNGSGGTDSAVSFDGRGYDVGVAYAFEAAEVSLSYYNGEVEDSPAAGDSTHETIMLSGNYELGPGVSVLASVFRTKYDADTGTDNDAWVALTGLTLEF